MSFGLEMKDRILIVESRVTRVCCLPCVLRSKDTPPVPWLLIGSPVHVHFFDWLTAVTMCTSPSLVKTHVFTLHVIVEDIQTPSCLIMSQFSPVVGYILFPANSFDNNQWKHCAHDRSFSALLISLFI